MSQETPATRVTRVRHELRRRQLQVLRIEQLSPHVRAITFGGAEIAGFVSASFDDHVKLILPGGDGEPVMRDYTPRHHDARRGELTIEFALHGDGPAARWAARAVPGDTATIGGPRGSFVVPTDYAWHLFAGDLSALPAMARRLEELPAGSRAFVLAQVAEADRRELPTQAQLTLQWVDTEAGLPAAARALALPPGEGYAWAGGEARSMAALRDILVNEKGVSRHASRISAYWKHGATGHHEDLA